MKHLIFVFTNSSVAKDIETQMDAFKRKWKVEYHCIPDLSRAIQTLKKKDAKSKVVVFMRSSSIQITQEALDIIHLAPFCCDKEGHVMAGELSVLKPMFGGKNTMKGVYKKYLPTFKTISANIVPVVKPQFSTTTTMATGMRKFEADITISDDESEPEEPEPEPVVEPEPEPVVEPDQESEPESEEDPAPVVDEIITIENDAPPSSPVDESDPEWS